MELSEAIDRRRSLRSLKPAEITRETVDELARAAQLAPSCFNNQPWRYVFTYEAEVLGRLKDALNEGNRWAREASMIIAVFSKPEEDCVIGDRVYNLFDSGMATAILMLKATELGLVAHPIAGFSPKKVGEVLGIPEEYQVLALLIVGAHSDEIPDYFKDYQVEAEKERPPRKKLKDFAYHSEYGGR